MGINSSKLTWREIKKGSSEREVRVIEASSSGFNVISCLGFSFAENPKWLHGESQQTK